MHVPGAEVRTGFRDQLSHAVPGLWQIEVDFLRRVWDGRVSKCGEVSKSFFSPVIMYVQHPRAYLNSAEQLVEAGTKLNPSGDTRTALFSLAALARFSCPSLHNRRDCVSNTGSEWPIQGHCSIYLKLISHLNKRII